MIETQMVLNEAQIAIKATRENTDLVVMSTMVFDKGPRGFFTMWGTTPEDAAKGLREAGADVVGSNCGNGIDKMTEIAEQMRSRSRLPNHYSVQCWHPGLQKRRDHLPRIARLHGRTLQDARRNPRPNARRLLRHHTRPHPGAGRSGQVNKQQESQPLPTQKE